MKVVLKRLIKEDEEKEAHIKLHNEKITRKLKKQVAQSLVKSSESEKEERVSVQSKASDKEVHSKKGVKLKNDGSPILMIVEQIQDLIANIVKA